MTFLLSLTGVALAVAIMVVSGVMNARYGMSLAREGIDQWVVMGVSGFADVGKAVAFIFMMSAFGRRAWGHGIMAGLVFLLCLSYAVTGSLGYLAMQRTMATGQTTGTALNVRGLEADLTRKETQLATLGSGLPASVLRQRIEAEKHKREWASTRECTNATASGSRQFCEKLKDLEADVLTAEARARLESEVATLRSKTAQGAAWRNLEKGDVLSVLLNRLTGFGIGDLQISLQLLGVAMVEAGACFMLGLSLAHGQAGWAAWQAKRQARREARAAAKARDVTPASMLMAVANADAPTPMPAASIGRPVAEPSPVVAKRHVANAPRSEPRILSTSLVPAATGVSNDNVVGVVAQDEPGGGSDEVRELSVMAFAAERLDPYAGGVEAEDDLRREYVSWCRAHNHVPLDEAAFVERFAELCGKLGVQRGEHNGRMFVLDVKLVQPRRRRARA